MITAQEEVLELTPLVTLGPDIIGKKLYDRYWELIRLTTLGGGMGGFGATIVGSAGGTSGLIMSGGACGAGSLAGPLLGGASVSNIGGHNPISIASGGTVGTPVIFPSSACNIIFTNQTISSNSISLPSSQTIWIDPL